MSQLPRPAIWIAVLAVALVGAVFAGCGEDESTETGGSGPPVAATSSIDGVYGFEVTDDDLRQSGVTSPGQIAENHGEMTYTLKNGEACWEQKAPNAVANPSDCQPYGVDGDRVTFSYPSSDPDVYRWKKLANGDLDLSFVSAEAGEEGVVKASAIPTWKRTGDAE